MTTSNGNGEAGGLCFNCGALRAPWSAWHKSEAWVHLCRRCRWGCPDGCKRTHTSVTGQVNRFPWESFSLEVGGHIIEPGRPVPLHAAGDEVAPAADGAARPTHLAENGHQAAEPSTGPPVALTAAGEANSAVG